MIKRKLSKIPKSILENSRKDVPLIISGYDLITDTKEFLNAHYKGCFESQSEEYITRSVFISVKKYSLFLRIIFKSVFGREVIKITTENNTENIIFKIAFDTSVLTSEEKEELLEISVDSEFSVKFSDNCVIVKIPFITSSFSSFNAISPRIVYNTLKTYFFA